MKHSESIINIAKALQEFNKEITNIPQTAKNPFYNSSYAPLGSIIDTVRPIANKYGLSILQDLGDYNTISTMILHVSGEWICQEGMKMPLEKNTPQGAGSAVTYGRRYSLSAMLNLATEEDDDGNSHEKKPDTANKIKTEFAGTDVTSEDMMKPGQQIIQEYWDLPKEKKHTMMPKGYCAIQNPTDKKWYVRPLSEKKQ
jgi:hypothetical protein